MIKRIAVICVALAFCSCASSGSGSSVSNPSPPIFLNSYWYTLPRPGTLFIIGTSGKQQKPENEIDIAREDAARKASMYHSVFASYHSVQNIGSSIFDYYSASEINLIYDTDLEKYKERLVFDEKRDVRTSDRGVFVRFAYPASFPGSIFYHFRRNSNGSPEWTTRPPREISGFMTGVGFSPRQFYFRDTFEKSCDAAVAALVSQLSTTVTTRETSINYYNTSHIDQQSSGNLADFLVLEIWVDPNTQAVWTLAIARKPQ